MEEVQEFVSLQEAADRMGVSRFKMWRLVKDGELTTYVSARDRREKLVRMSDVEALIRPRERDQKKQAA